ncbi:MAG: metallophosphoesterase family protein, partial [bacterium]
MKFKGMKRNRKISEKPDAILTSDWHLRETKPRCRTDNFWETQWKKVNSIWKIQTEWEDDIKLFHAGDLFHHWKPSPWLISMTMKHLPENFYTVFGQHDLPNHNMSLSEKSGVMTLAVAGWIKLIEEGSWKEGLRNSIPLKLNGRNIAILHQFVWGGKKIPWPGCSELTAEQMLDKYPQFDLIVTGDHHKPFTYEKDGRLLVNPGPLTRQKADETFNPRVYLWYSNTNT